MLLIFVRPLTLNNTSTDNFCVTLAALPSDRSLNYRDTA
jgi:hypothetical protein